MTMDEEQLRNFLSDDDNIEKLIKTRPQTYNSVLGIFNKNGTFQQILRRRLSRMFKEQRVWKIRIPGTRWGLVLYCHPNNDYKIISTYGIMDVNIYYTYKIKETEDNLIIKDCWELVGDNWSKWRKKEEGLNIPKNKLRYGCYRIWD